MGIVPPKLVISYPCDQHVSVKSRQVYIYCAFLQNQIILWATMDEGIEGPSGHQRPEVEGDTDSSSTSSSGSCCNSNCGDQSCGPECEVELQKTVSCYLEFFQIFCSKAKSWIFISFQSTMIDYTSQGISRIKKNVP